MSLSIPFITNYVKILKHTLLNITTILVALKVSNSSKTKVLIKKLRRQNTNYSKKLKKLGYPTIPEEIKLDILTKSLNSKDLALNLLKSKSYSFDFLKIIENIIGLSALQLGFDEID